jgi:hypothetical protein
MKNPDQANAELAAVVLKSTAAGGEVSTARPKKTPRAAPSLGMLLGRLGKEISRQDARLLTALSQTHPRQFWSAAKDLLSWSHPEDEALQVLRACASHPTLLRAGLSVASKVSKTDGVGSNPTLSILLGASLRLKNKSPQYHEERMRSAAQLLSGVSASDMFHLLVEPAEANNAHATLAAARAMPDAHNPQEARRFTYGQTSFASAGLMGESKLLARAFIQAQAAGLQGIPATRRERCDNAFFWIAHRHREALASGSVDAPTWAEAARLLVRRAPKLAEDGATLSLILASEELRPLLPATPSKRHFSGWWNQTRLCFETLSMAQGSAVAPILNYFGPDLNSKLVEADAGENAPKARSGAPKMFSGGLPGWAVALLAGHAPEASWMPAPDAEAARATFKLPRALVAKARDGSMLESDLSGPTLGASGASFDASSLCKALGHAWGPAPKSKARASVKA